MEKFIYSIINLIYTSHSYILSLNDAYEYNFTDKELHFLVIGIIGMAMVVAVYPVFRWLAKHNHIMTITWVYVFTLVIVLTFTIEIGQKAGNSGTMDFADIMYGVVGFLTMYAVFIIIRAAVKGIYRLFRKICRPRKKADILAENTQV